MTSDFRMSSAEPLNEFQRERRPSSFRRWLFRVSILASLIAIVIGVRFCFTEPPPLPEIPEVNLEGFDPEISATIRMGRYNVGQNPRISGTWSELALVLHAHGFEDQAVICYEATATLDPQNYLWPYLEGIVLHKSPRGPEAAIACFERAVSLTSVEITPRLWLAEMLLEVGRLDESAAEFGKVLTPYPDNDRAKFGLGKLAFARQQYEKALHYLEEVANHPSAQKESCALRSVIYERLGDRAAAERERRQLAQLTSLNSSWPDATSQLLVDRRAGLVARLQRVRQFGIDGRTNEAIILLYETAKLYPDSDETWYSLGKLLFLSKNMAGAELSLRKSIELVPTQAEYRLMLGVVELSQLKHEEAAQDFQKAIELKSLDGRAHSGLGQSLEAQGDRPGAIEAYRQALRYAPNDDVARQRLQKLIADP